MLLLLLICVVGTDLLKRKKRLINLQERSNNRPQHRFRYKTPKEIIDFELKNVA